MLPNMQLGFLSHLAASALLYAAFLIPPSKLAHTKLALAFLPAIWALHIYSWSVGVGFLAAVQLFWANELLLFRDPREKFKVIHRHPNPVSPSAPLKQNVDMDKLGQKREESGEVVKNDPKSLTWKEPYPSSFRKRCSWVFKLLVSMRYIGWDIGDSSGTKPPISTHLVGGRRTRICWLIRNIFFAGLCFCIIDATNLYQHFDPYFQVDTQINAPFPLNLAAFLSRYSLGFLPPEFVRITVLFAQQYAVFTMINLVLGVIHVSLGGIGLLDDWWGGMESWPCLMGSPLIVAEGGLRGFWGRAWHQLFRNLLTSPAKVFVGAIGIPPKSFSAYMIKVVVAFLLSGVIHAATLPHNIPGASPLRYASFFWIQGACVLGEVIMEHALQGSGRLKPRARWMRWGVGLCISRPGLNT
ncbi:hypothetical protein L207DRAFT_607219 [Hyaloscypha variabilis F]|uniref:Wax synthase domain-containing protein n=1 Tax=Hyaloscypha variabilis (strain UAMH 11265 / GT02V1 / F) TaxID=1149755 RepID=A0A2J6SAE5_HYAVF|nr:hypothetical protein L207DRAFT_607219 [Hyaloscypha variabilis F]